MQNEREGKLNMASTETYAQLALYVYNIDDEANPANRPLVPDGWELLEYHPDNSWGFSWGAFRREGSDEVVIAYTGTNSGIDWVANLANGGGMSSSQTTEAALAYLTAKANYGSNITFTGHSLGGGLASIMAVWFDRPATTFDEAPFELTARSPWAIPATKLALAAAGFSDPAFTSYTGLFDFNDREGNVSHHYLQGEVLDALRTLLPEVAGFDHMVSANVGGLGVPGAVTLHSQALLTALLMSNDFRQATYVSDFVLPLLMDEDFYAYSASTSSQKNIVVDFIRSEQALGAGNGKLGAYAADLQRIGTDAAGLTEAARKALIAQGMEWYYWQGSDWGGESFFADTDGVLQYTIAIGDGLAGAQNKAAAYVQSWLAPVANDHGEFYYANFATYAQWSVVTGTGGTAAALDAAKSQLFVGSDGGDTFTGGDLADLMFAGEGADTLNGGGGDDNLYGGAGDDALNGGTGYDRYRAEGHDTITDADGRGYIEDKDGRRISGVVEKREDGSYVFLADGSITVKGGTDLTLTLADGTQVTITAFQDGDLGIHLDEDGGDPETSRDIIGDLQPVDFEPGVDGVQTRVDDLGNVIVNPSQPQPGRADYLQDSAGNDNVQGGGGNDILDAWRGGDDLLDAGAGDDIVVARAGDDVVAGGAGNDLLRGDSGRDEVHAGEIATVEDALAAGDGPGTGLKGDFIDGSEDDDLVIGDAGNDALNGGPGNDVIVAGAGDDDIDGDLETNSVTFGWNVVRSIQQDPGGGTIYFSQYNNVDFDSPTTGGDDAIYAGGGEDWVRGGYGDDYIDGGSQDDVLFGNAGHDEVFGGAGADVVAGDSSSNPPGEHGDDYLEGEDGDDTVWGYGGSDAIFGGEGNDLLVADSNNGADGEDYVDGEAGDDSMAGGGGGDWLYGGTGNDFLQGDSGTGEGDGDDMLVGEDGDDLLIGEGGRDTLVGGAGADQIGGDGFGGDPGGQADAIFGDAGNDTVDAQGGDDFVDAGADNDLVAAGEGNDTVQGGDGADQLQGGEGHDALEGGAGSDTLFGEAGNDVLTGGAETDFLVGGDGDDALDGGDGDDVYYYFLGEGEDTIADSSGTDWLVFQDILWGQLALNVGSLQLVMPDGGAIHLEDFDPANPLAGGGIEWFQFADGAVLGKNQLISLLGLSPTGTPGADTLAGTAFAETIHALEGDDIVTGLGGNDVLSLAGGDDEGRGAEGNDSLLGGAGNDTLLGEAGNDTLAGEGGADLLVGGAGTDLLLGGDGDDTYFFAAGDGQDTARDTAGDDIVALAPTLTLDAIVFSRAGDDLVIAVRGSTDRLTVEDWFTPGGTFSNVVLGDGTWLDHAGVEANMPTNQAPAAAPDTAFTIEDAVPAASGNVLANDSDAEGRPLRVTTPGTFNGAHGTLTVQSDGSYQYLLANGSAAVQGLASGQSATDVFSYMVTDDDPAGAASAQGTLTVTIQGANDAPVLAADQGYVYEDEGGPVGGNVLANDSDVDAGTTLQVVTHGTIDTDYGAVALGPDGSWTYTLDDAGPAQALAEGQTVTETFTYLVSDGHVQVQGSLAVLVTGRNDAPELAAPLEDQTAGAGRNWSWQVPAGTFTDVDAGDVLSFRAMLADGSDLPSWLTFDAATRTFSGRVPRDMGGSLDILVQATDGWGNGEVPSDASDIFTLAFTSGHGGGGGGNGGGPKGNEGVGNGEDPPPPGHEYNFNDGPGTAPGDPGAAGGNGYVPPGHPDPHQGLQDVGSLIGRPPLVLTGLPPDSVV
jgi:VCBS repeat-containing protein